MNWYGILKYAQIWEVFYNEDFETELSALYELEYKYSMMLRMPFNGMEKRKNNMLAHLREELESVAREVYVPVEYTLKNWLDNHAILSPQTWAANRVKTDPEYEMLEYDFGRSSLEQMLYGIIGEYARYAFPGQVLVNIEKDAGISMMKEIAKNIAKFPSFQKIVEEYSNEYRDVLREDLNYEGLEEFGQRFGQNFATEEDAEQFIDSYTENAYDVFENLGLTYGNVAETLAALLENSGNWENILIEMNRELVFPKWFIYWQSMGIEQTRQMVQEAYDMLVKADPSNDTLGFVTALNHAINVEHQNGSMLEYLQENSQSSSDLGGALFELSNAEGKTIEKWNNELREVGVQI